MRRYIRVVAIQVIQLDESAGAREVAFSKWLNLVRQCVAMGLWQRVATASDTIARKRPVVQVSPFFLLPNVKAHPSLTGR